MTTPLLLTRADDVLRGRPWTLGADRPWGAVGPLAVIIVAFGMTYGAAMGSFGGLGGDRPLMVAYSALKVPLLLLATMALCLPSFFVVNSLMGVREDFPDAIRALLATQAALTIVLVSLAPVTLTWYASSADYHGAILFNAAIFGVSSLGAQLVLRRAYRPLVARNPVHRSLLRAWLVLFAFVGTEMGWLLRPFIGNPDQPVQFFRDDAFGNAYLVVARMVWEKIAG